MIPDENSHGIGTQLESCENLKWPISDDFGLRSPVVQKKISPKKGICEIKGGGHRVPPAGLPIEQVLGEYSLSFLRRDVALFVSTRARDSF